MTEDQLLLAHVSDKKQSCAMMSMVTNTEFLDVRQRSLIVPLEREMNTEVQTFYCGGYDGAERLIAVFVPSFFQAESLDDVFGDDDNPLTLLKISKDRFSDLTHRDYLGAIMGLGLKREMLGDIIVEKDGCFLVCLSSVADYLCENLTSAGRGTVTTQKVGFELLQNREEHFETITAFVSSLRLDNLVTAAFNVSRTLATEAIGKGIVFVDGVEVNKPDKQIGEKSKIVFRKKGKVLLDSVDGKSKKGRLHITIKRYI